jgi:hypothetical protein
MVIGTDAPVLTLAHVNEGHPAADNWFYLSLASDASYLGVFYNIHLLHSFTKDPCFPIVFAKTDS